MSCAKRMKKVFTLVMAVVMIFSMAIISAEAASTEGTAHELYYTIYDENNEIVEEGIIPLVNENGRYTWKGSISLRNGFYTAFRQPGEVKPSAFYATDNTMLTFSYELDKIAKIEYFFYQDSVPVCDYPTRWKTGTVTSKGTSITKTTDKTAYYYVGVCNASSDEITISNVSFVF